MKGSEDNAAEEMILLAAQSMRQFGENGALFGDPQGLLQADVDELRSRPTLSNEVQEALECVERVMAHPDFKRQPK